MLSQHSKSNKKSKLKVFSFTHQKEKILHGDTVGKFTTDPRLGGLYVPDILKFLSDSFPLCVRLCLEDGSGESSFPPSLTSDPLLLLGSTVETSVIATCTVLPERSVSGSLGRTTLVDIPLSQDVLVNTANREPREKAGSLETLHAKTVAVWKDLMSLDSENALPQRLKVSPEDKVQHELFARVRKGWEREGQSLKAPPLIKKEIPGIPIDPNLQSYQVLMDGSLSSSPYTPLLSTSLSSETYSTADDIDSVGKDEDHSYEDQMVDSDQDKVSFFFLCHCNHNMLWVFKISNCNSAYTTIMCSIQRK